MGWIGVYVALRRLVICLGIFALVHHRLAVTYRDIGLVTSQL